MYRWFFRCWPCLKVTLILMPWSTEPWTQYKYFINARYLGDDPVQGHKPLCYLPYQLNFLVHTYTMFQWLFSWLLHKWRRRLPGICHQHSHWWQWEHSVRLSASYFPGSSWSQITFFCTYNVICRRMWYLPTLSELRDDKVCCKKFVGFTVKTNLLC